MSLSGDGGDELLGGYNRYYWASLIWRKVGWVPRPFRAALAGVLSTVPHAAWDAVINGIGRLLPARFQYSEPGSKLRKLAEILAVRAPEEIHWCLVSQWKHPVEIVPGSSEPMTVLTDAGRWANVEGLENHMMYRDLVTYLPDDILVKLDRASMGVSLESRTPFLDHRVVEFAWRLPLSMKIRDGQSKWILRQVLYRYVPRELVERPKMGFGVPIGAWLRGPLRDWAEAYLDHSKLAREGFLNAVLIRQKWNEHLSGRRDWQQFLWSTLMFQAWRERWG